ncbi:MAG: hypothetical protein ACLR1P_07795 [Oscillospiraceae bacterium]
MPERRAKAEYDRWSGRKPPARRKAKHEERPQEINDRQTFGHWEGDCVCGKKRTKETLFVLSERLTRNEIIIKMPDQTAASVIGGAEQIRTPLREEVFTDIQKHYI